MNTRTSKLVTLADQLDALVLDVEKVGKADVKMLKSSLERIQRAPPRHSTGSPP